MIGLSKHIGLLQGICLRRFSMPFVALLGMLMTSACGGLSSDNESGNTPVDQFSLTGDETTKIDAKKLTETLNNEALLGTIKIDELLKLVPAIPALSRMNTSDFQACVKKRLSDVPVSVTTDTLSVQYDLDFIASCDEAIKPEDKITTLENRVTGKLAVICQGAGFAQWEGRTWGEASNTSLVAACSNGRQIQFASSYAVTARKLAKTTVGDGNAKKEIDQLATQLVRASLTTADGSPCTLKVENKIWTMETCRKVTYVRQYTGAPESENISPNATDKTERPYVQQSEVLWANAKFLEGDRYFHAGATQFNFSNWKGAMTYTNGWAAPKWDASLDAESTNGTFGQPYKQAAATPK